MKGKVIKKPNKKDETFKLDKKYIEESTRQFMAQPDFQENYVEIIKKLSKM